MPKWRKSYQNLLFHQKLSIVFFSPVTSGLQSASSAAAASVPEIATRLQIDHNGQIHDVIAPTFASNAPTFDDPILPGPPQDAVTKSALQLNAAGFQQAAASRNDIGSHLGDMLIPGPPHETPNDIVTHAAVTKSCRKKTY